MTSQPLRDLAIALVMVPLAGSALLIDTAVQAEDSPATMTAPAPHVARTVADGTTENVEAAASEIPAVDIRGADQEQTSRIEKALDRFDEAGLDLPPLIIEIHDSEESCDGHGGLFVPSSDVSRVELCSPETFILLHELGHAWESISMTDPEREAFVELAELPSWDDRSTAWKDRGREVVANTIATGLAYRELSGPDLRQFETQLGFYEVLTGAASPRIVE